MGQKKHTVRFYSILLALTLLIFGYTLYLCLRPQPVSSKEEPSSGSSMSSGVSEEKPPSESSSGPVSDGRIGGTDLPWWSMEEENVDNLDPDKPIVALTFDDGPSQYTKRIVDTLTEYNSKATFFVMGYRLEEYGENTLYAFNHGMEIGNHSYSHKQFVGLNQHSINQQMNDTNKLIKDLTGKEPRLYRPPYGRINQMILSKIPMAAILWNVDPQDGKAYDAQEIVDNVMEDVKDGSIILLHDVYEKTADALDILLPKLIEEGYQVTNVSQMFACRGEPIEINQKYYFLTDMKAVNCTY